MNIKRFHAATSREALAKARMAFGDGTLILSNRPTPTGVEVVATAEDSLSALDQASDSQQPRSQLQAPPQRPAARPAAKAAPQPEPNPVEEDTTQLAMSTLSFQDYVRERMLRRRHEATSGHGEETLSGEPLFEAQSAPAPAPAPKAAPAPAPRATHAAPFTAPA
ncbi:MAG: flagellar biosynthesis protein FlhF, partial [Rhodoferax sp.]|nr:flagellar biosynthesis protein FlhF [Rhodoferax sp.]